MMTRLKQYTIQLDIFGESPHNTAKHKLEASWISSAISPSKLLHHSKQSPYFVWTRAYTQQWHKNSDTPLSLFGLLRFMSQLMRNISTNS